MKIEKLALDNLKKSVPALSWISDTVCINNWRSVLGNLRACNASFEERQIYFQERKIQISNKAISRVWCMDANRVSYFQRSWFLHEVGRILSQEYQLKQEKKLSENETVGARIDMRVMTQIDGDEHDVSTGEFRQWIAGHLLDLFWLFKGIKRI